ncbi:MAG: Spy/CpxP family protein refolding chaperone [Alphaproteobacteria bacterium]
MTRLQKPVLAAALFAGVAAIGLTPALAQNAPAPADTGAPAREGHHQARARMMPGQFIDGRIAFLKAQLKITPAQEGQWQKVEAAMRENAKALDQTIATARQKSGDRNAVERLEMREQFAKVRAENSDRILAAFKPLYGSLSQDQQKMADQLIGAAGRHWRHRA